MARMLILPSALEELRSVVPLARRRGLVACLSELDGARRRHRISRGGRCLMVAAGRRVLYRLRPDGSLVVVAIVRPR